jgi:hypothetical protein
MISIDEWARRHNIAPAALEELKACMGVTALGAMGVPDNRDPPGSEGRQQSLVRLEAANLRIRLFRNNSGAFEDADGRVVRYGLANESKQANAILKSPDLIGWRKRLITPDMVGMVIGQACMREIKHEGWKFSPTDKHEAAQFNFLKLAIADGCDAAFATGPGTL